MCGERSRRSPVQQARGGGETYVHTPRSQQSPLVVYRRETFRRLLIFSRLDSEQLQFFTVDSYNFSRSTVSAPSTAALFSARLAAP